MRFGRFVLWYSGVLFASLIGIRHALEPLTPMARWHQWSRWDNARRRWGMR